MWSDSNKRKLVQWDGDFGLAQYFDRIFILLKIH